MFTEPFPVKTQLLSWNVSRMIEIRLELNAHTSLLESIVDNVRWKHKQPQIISYLMNSHQTKRYIINMTNCQKDQQRATGSRRKKNVLSVHWHASRLAYRWNLFHQLRKFKAFVQIDIQNVIANEYFIRESNKNRVLVIFHYFVNLKHNETIICEIYKK